jgi:hypothetical protein
MLIFSYVQYHGKYLMSVYGLTVSSLFPGLKQFPANFCEFCHVFCPRYAAVDFLFNWLLAFIFAVWTILLFFCGTPHC